MAKLTNNNKVTFNMFWWLTVINFVLITAPWWLALSTVFRVTSLVALFVATALLVINDNLKRFGETLSKDSVRKAYATNWSLIPRGVDFGESLASRRPLLASLVFGLTYVVFVCNAAAQITHLNTLYFFIAGWAGYCLLLDFQIGKRVREITIANLINQLEDFICEKGIELEKTQDKDSNKHQPQPHAAA